ncbi:MAG: hypothetical protein AB7P21_31115 [Lautropia sp.]
MNEFKSALQRATSDGEFIAALLQAVAAMMVRADAQIDGFARASSSAPIADLRRMSVEFERHMSVAIELGRIAAQTATASLDALSRARGIALRDCADSPERRLLLDACDRTVRTLEVSRQSVRQSNGRIADAVRTLGAAARDRDGSPVLADEVRAMLARIATLGPDRCDAGN